MCPLAPIIPLQHSGIIPLRPDWSKQESLVQEKALFTVKPFAVCPNVFLLFWFVGYCYSTLSSCSKRLLNDAISYTPTLNYNCLYFVFKISSKQIWYWEIIIIALHYITVYIGVYINDICLNNCSTLRLPFSKKSMELFEYNFSFLVLGGHQDLLELPGNTIIK